MRDVKQSACDMARYRLQRADEDLASANSTISYLYLFVMNTEAP